MWYIAEHNLYSLLGSRVMDRIMQDFWKSNMDVSGNIMEASTAYRIISRSSFAFTRDEEKEQRFYKRKDMSKLKSHPFQFHVWKKSMLVRYAIEAFSFVALAFFF